MHASPLLDTHRRQRGLIPFIPGPLTSVYASTKRYLVAFAEALSLEMKTREETAAIRVRCIAPAHVQAGNTPNWFNEAEVRGYATPDQVAKETLAQLDSTSVVLSPLAWHSLQLNIVTALPRWMAGAATLRVLDQARRRCVSGEGHGFDTQQSKSKRA